MRLILILIAALAWAEDKPAVTMVDPQPIAAEDIAIVNALGSALQEHQKQVQAAVAKQEVRICQEAKIQRDACLVDWQHGTVGVKPKETPKPVAETPSGK